MQVSIHNGTHLVVTQQLLYQFRVNIPAKRDGCRQISPM